MRQRSRRYRRVVVGVVWSTLMCGATVHVAAAPEHQAEAARLYQQGYDLVLNELWEAAGDILREVSRRFPDSDWADDSRFWTCHADARVQNDARQAFACFEAFTGQFPGSSYIDDAQVRMIELGQTLAREGNLEYAERWREYAARWREDAERWSSLRQGEEDVALIALKALADIGDEESLQALLSLYDTDLSEAMRSRLVRLLEDFDSPEARARLIDIARRDPSLRVRTSAIRTLGELEWDDELSAFMRELALTGETPEVRRQAVRAFGEHRDEQWIPFLVEVASTTDDGSLGRAALGSIEDIGGPQVGSAAETVYRDAAAPAVRRRALGLMADQGGDAMLTQLEQIALAAEDASFRRAALRAIGEVSSEAAFGVLSRLATDSSDASTRASAVRALEDADANLAVPLLVQVLSQDADAAVRRRAARTLGDMESDQAVEALKNAAMNDSDAGVQRAAVNALGDIGTSAAREALIELLNRD